MADRRSIFFSIGQLINRLMRGAVFLRQIDLGPKVLEGPWPNKCFEWVRHMHFYLRSLMAHCHHLKKSHFCISVSCCCVEMSCVPLSLLPRFCCTAQGNAQTNSEADLPRLSGYLYSSSNNIKNNIKKGCSFSPETETFPLEIGLREKKPATGPCLSSYHNQQGLEILPQSLFPFCTGVYATSADTLATKYLAHITVFMLSKAVEGAFNLFLQIFRINSVIKT